MHIGGVRTALFSYLLAKQSNGDFILRIEDTDKAREVEGSIQQIIDSLEWIGIEIDEGPKHGGDTGPYKQSDRLEIYKKWANKLIEDGHAYADPYSAEELAEFRAKAKSEERPFLYRYHRPDNSAPWDGSTALRFRTPDIKRYEWTDEVRGKLSAGEEALDDFILIKADGYPTYNFAHVVDDHEMGITHVVRGEEFISSTPKFLSLYDALGFEKPKFITAAPILNKNGGKKLSKRDGAKSALDYRDLGYPPEAIMNFLASLGWNDGSEQEIFSPQELIEKFSIDKMQKSGARYDEERLTWMSGHHIRAMSVDELFDKSNEFWSESSKAADQQDKKKILGLIQERLKFYSEIPELSDLFFTTPDPIATKQLIASELGQKLDEDSRVKFLNTAIEELEISDFNVEDLEKRLRSLVEKLETKAGLLFRLIRIGATGSTVAPGLFETLNALGKEETLNRLKSLQ